MNVRCPLMNNFNYCLASPQNVQIGDFYFEGKGLCALTYVGSKGFIIETSVDGDSRNRERQTLPFETHGKFFGTKVLGVFFRKNGGGELVPTAIGKDYAPSAFGVD